MTNRALTFTTFAAMAALMGLAAPAEAQTECQPGDLFCAELRIGPGSAGVRIGGDRQPVPPPPPQQEAPPVVVVQPQPEPPPPTVIVQPAPPVQQYEEHYQEDVYEDYDPGPQVVHVPRRRRAVPVDRFPYSSVGLNLHISNAFTEHGNIFGGGGSLRLRPIPHIAVDLGAGFYGGVDYNGADRIELPVTADMLVFFNPYQRFQFYAVAGVGGSWANANGRDMGYLGGQLGLGAEWRIGRSFALSFDVR